MDQQNASQDNSFGEELNKIASAAAEQACGTSASLTKETETRLKQARRYAAEKVEQLRRLASDKAEMVRRHAGESWDATCDKAKDLHKAGEEYVKSNPTKATLITLGIGFVLGVLIGSSRR